VVGITFGHEGDLDDAFVAALMAEAATLPA
jgi:hypothetical protein